MHGAIARLGVAACLLAGLAWGCGASSSDRPDFGGLDNPGPDASPGGLGDTLDPEAGGASDVPHESPDTPVDAPADTPPSGGTTDAEGTADESEPDSPFFPSPELFLKILGPSPDGFAASAGSMIAVQGILGGEADEITWTGPGGQGAIVPARFWASEGIELTPGDNVITVTARLGQETVTDQVRVVYTPAYMFSQKPLARPDVAFVNEPVDVVFTLSLGTDASGEADVALYATGPDLSPGAKVGAMLDDGKVGTSGDEIAHDGIATLRTKVKCTEPGPVAWRVGVRVTTGVSSYVAYSTPVHVDCVSHLTLADCQAALDTQKAANGVIAAKKADLPAAQAAVLDYLKAAPSVQEAGFDPDYGVWALYKSGVLGVLSLAPAGLRAAPGLGQDEIASKRSLVLAPYSPEFGTDDEAAAIGQSLKNKQCPTYGVSGPHLGAQSTLARLRAGMTAGILALTTHGDTYFKDLSADARKAFGWSHPGSQEVLSLGEPVTCSQMLSKARGCSSDNKCPPGSECVITTAQDTYLSGMCVDRNQADLKRGRVAITGDGNYAVLPSFFQRYGSAGMPDSLVYLGACRGLRVGPLVAALIGAGARAVVGFTGYVSSKFAAQAGTEFFQHLVDEGRTAGESMPAVTKDPDHPGTRFVLVGAKDLTATNPLIMNQGFERGDLTGWDQEGDGRVVTRLGVSRPVSGKFMGIISTGLGYTTELGRIEQTFCIPAGTYSFQFYWKFYSEEFREFCGSQYQDTFRARLVNSVGQEVSIVNASVDDLCDPEDCEGCCQSQKCVGLVTSDVQFDQGDVWMVPKWQKAKVDISAYADKGPVALSFFCTDKGDSIYDTAVLVDALQFK